MPRGPGSRERARAVRPSPGGQGPGQGGKSPWPEPRHAVGSYGAVARGLQDPGRGLSPGLPDAPARRETVAGERTPRPCICRPGLSRPLCPGGPEPPLGVGKERPWLPLSPAVLSLRPRLAPRGQRIRIRCEDAASGCPLGVQRNAPSLLSAEASDPGPTAGHPAPSASTPACPGRPPLWEELARCLSRAPWLALHLMGAGAGAQVSGDGGRPPGSRPPSAHALCFRRRRSWTGAETCSLAPCPFSFRVVRSARPLLPSGVRSHVGTAPCG